MQALLTRLMPPTRVTFCAMQASHLSSSGYVSASAARIVFSCEPYTPHTMQAESSRQLCLSFSRLPSPFSRLSSSFWLTSLLCSVVTGYAIWRVCGMC